MKKKLVLLITLIVSLFIYSGRVEAAKELTCIYGSTNSASIKNRMFVQKSDGSYLLYIGGSTDNPKASGWELVTSNIEIQFGIGDDKVDGPIDKCYERSWLVAGTKKYIFHNENNHDLSGTNTDLPKIYEGFEVPTVSDSIVGVDDDFSEIINNTKWNGWCEYSFFKIYFNNEKYVIEMGDYAKKNLNSIKAFFSIDDFLTYNQGYCPPYIYSEVYSEANNTYTSKMDYSIRLFKTSHSFATPLKDSWYDSNYKYKEDNPDLPIETCKDLIGEEVFDKINQYFSIIRIIIPILLIGFGIFDFAKAIFGNEENMKKARKKFIMRIVAAILFFLLPLFLKLILSIANSVWEFINPETCISVK